MLLNVLSRINAKGKAHNKMPQGEIRGCSSLVTLLLPHVLWQLNEMLKYQLYRGNYNWALKRSPPRLSVDCKSKIVLASCIPSKVLFWQKKMLCCHVRDILQYSIDLSVWVGGHPGTLGIMCYDVFGQSSPGWWPRGGWGGVFTWLLCWCVYVWRLNTRGRQWVFVLMSRAASLVLIQINGKMLQLQLSASTHPKQYECEILGMEYGSHDNRLQ